MIAVIGGSGLTRLPELHLSRQQIVRTPYGLPSSPLFMGKLGSQDIVFLARHGLNHSHAPHEINYRANIWALHSVGTKQIISVSAVACLSDGLKAGELVLPDDLIDYTSGRANTFFEGKQQVVHTDFTYPYDRELRKSLLEHAHTQSVVLHSKAVYGCIQGPRLPTRAEARRYRQDGVDILGMTGMPEATLARELNIPYAHLCGVIGVAANPNCPDCPDFSSREEHKAIKHIRQLLIVL